MKKLFVSALILVGVSATAQPLATTTKSTKLSNGQCKLDITYNEVIGGSSAANKINAQIQAVVSQHVKNYKDILPNCTNQLTVPWTIEHTITVTYNDGNWSSWKEEGYDFTGGAHSNGSLSYFVFDSQGTRVLFVDALAAPPQYILNSIRAKVKAEAREQYEEDSFTRWASSPAALINLNYSADQSGIKIFFNSYEIASYAAGPVEIQYTWAELKPLLKANSAFREALK